MKTKDLRNTLCDALKKVEEGKLTHNDARAIIGLANQVQLSLATECKVIELKLRMGSKVDAIGHLNVTE